MLEHDAVAVARGHRGLLGPGREQAADGDAGPRRAALVRGLAQEEEEEVTRSDR